MSTITLAGIAIALISLIFSAVPFVQLVYILSINFVTTWEDWGIVTVFMIFATFGATIYRQLNK